MYIGVVSWRHWACKWPGKSKTSSARLTLARFPGNKHCNDDSKTQSWNQPFDTNKD